TRRWAPLRLQPWPEREGDRPGLLRGLRDARARDLGGARRGGHRLLPGPRRRGRARLAGRRRQRARAATLRLPPHARLHAPGFGPRRDRRGVQGGAAARPLLRPLPTRMIWIVALVLTTAWAFAMGVVIVLQRRSAAATIAWLLVLAFLPIIGLAIYRF